MFYHIFVVYYLSLSKKIVTLYCERYTFLLLVCTDHYKWKIYLPNKIPLLQKYSQKTPCEYCSKMKCCNQTKTRKGGETKRYLALFDAMVAKSLINNEYAHILHDHFCIMLDNLNKILYINKSQIGVAIVVAALLGKVSLLLQISRCKIYYVYLTPIFSSPI